MKRLCSTKDSIEAYLLKSFLASEGIETVIQGEQISTLQGAVPFSPETSPEVCVVDEEQYKRAVELLDDFQQQKPAESSTKVVCPKCGEKLLPQFTTCWKCGADRLEIGLGVENEKGLGSEPEREELSLEDEQPTGPDPNQSDATASISSDSGERQTSLLTRKELWLETFVVLWIAVIPPLYSCFDGWMWPYKKSTNLLGDYSWHLVNQTSVAIVILYIMYRSKDPLSTFGVARPRWISDTFIGIGVWLVDYNVGLFVSMLDDTPKGIDSATASLSSGSYGLTVYIMLVLSSIAVGCAEELAMRAFLIPRFEVLFRSTFFSVLASSLIFASYHLYQGIHATMYIFFGGLTYGVAFCLLRRVWPLVVAHAIHNIVVGII